MNKSIPQVRRWRVKFFVDCKQVNVLEVDTINKRFVRMAEPVVRAYWHIRNTYGFDAEVRLVISLCATKECADSIIVKADSYHI